VAADEGQLRAFTSAELTDMIQHNRNIALITNERGHSFRTFKTLGLRDAVFANGALYAHAKCAAAADFTKPELLGAWVVEFDKLPEHVQCFWATVYYNTGPETAVGILRRAGVEFTIHPGAGGQPCPVLEQREVQRELADSDVFGCSSTHPDSRLA